MNWRNVLTGRCTSRENAPFWSLVCSRHGIFFANPRAARSQISIPSRYPDAHHKNRSGRSRVEESRTDTADGTRHGPQPETCCPYEYNEYNTDRRGKAKEQKKAGANSSPAAERPWHGARIEQCVLCTWYEVTRTKYIRSKGRKNLVYPNHTHAPGPWHISRFACWCSRFPSFLIRESSRPLVLLGSQFFSGQSAVGILATGI